MAEIRIFKNASEVAAAIVGALLIFKNQFSEYFKKTTENKTKEEDQKVKSVLAFIKDIVLVRRSEGLIFDGAGVVEIIQATMDSFYSEELINAFRFEISEELLKNLTPKKLSFQDGVNILDCLSHVPMEDSHRNVIDRLILRKISFREIHEVEKENLKSFLEKMDSKEMWEGFLAMHKGQNVLSNSELLEMASKSRSFPRDKMYEIATSKD